MRNLVVAAIAFVAAFNIACSGGDQPPQGNDGVTVDSTEESADSGTGSAASSLSGSSLCDEERVGCPCTNEGAVFSCGHVKRIEGSYVTCTEQFSVCENGIWSKCGGNAQ